MPSKAKIRSMQRGAQKRNRAAPEPGGTYDLKPPRLIGKEYLHFGNSPEETAAFAEGLKPTIRALAANGIRKPKEIAKSLNQQDVRTKLSERWTPRLAWFLLGLIYGERQEKTPKRSARPAPKVTKPPKPEKPLKVRKPSDRVALTSTEIERRKQALAAN